MIASLLSKVFGTANARTLKALAPIVAEINAYEPTISALSDADLKEKTFHFKQQLAEGKTLDEILPEAYAVVREASKRTLGMRPFDVQLIGAIALHQGKIAEMKTGEGKTLTATLPLYLNALTGKGAHLVTVNDYLARRDAELNRPLYNFLGMEVSVIQHNMSDEERKKAYQADILYGTNNELGFDYLRDNMKFRLEDYVQRDLNFAIVDEVDSILIDEARTPLIISGPSDEGSSLYNDADAIVRKLLPTVDYEVDEKTRSAQLTESGNDKVEHALRIDNLYDPENLKLLHHITQALRAHALFKRDVDYVVRDEQVMIVDEFTGRILAGRRYSDGLHQALEAKEGVAVERESQTLASITLQNFFRLYRKLAGMTGTAATEAEEFHRIYNLDVLSIPTNVPMRREDKADLIFLTKNAKYKAILEDIKARHAKGQPVLIGTIAIETSELLSNILKMSGIPHEVLNAKQHEREADIVAFAGKPGRVTIATNMAGRGTDIKLTPESVQAGGLYILGTERHESRRIDNQLRGRSGRQGDPGESRFYISLEDDLIRIFAGESLKQNMQRWGMKEDEIIESSFVSKTIERAQEKVEKSNFETRKHLLEYDDVLNQHRKVIYAYRRSILDNAQDATAQIHELIAECTHEIISVCCPGSSATQEQATQAIESLSKLTHIPQQAFASAHLPILENTEQFVAKATEFIIQQYTTYRSKLVAERIADLERWMMLEAIDKAWKQHMLNIDHLKEGISYRGWGQKNPLYEYKKEAFQMFKDMLASIHWDIVHRIFTVNVAHFNQQELEQQRRRELQQLHLNMSEGEVAKAAAQQTKKEKKR